MPRGVENAQGVVSWVILTRRTHFWLQNKAIPKLFNSFTMTQTAPFKFLFSCARLRRLIRVSGRTMLRVPRVRRAAYSGPSGAVPPLEWPGSCLGRLSTVFSASCCIPGCSGVRVGTARSRLRKAVSWLQLQLAAMTSRRSHTRLGSVHGRYRGILARSPSPSRV